MAAEALEKPLGAAALLPQARGRVRLLCGYSGSKWPLEGILIEYYCYYLIVFVFY